MAIVGHWESLTEAQKLVQSVLLAGVIEETIEEGQLLPKLPVFQISGKSIKYNRESTLPSAAFYDINEQIPWTADVTYTTQVEVELKRVLRQDVLDKFMRDTYKDPNDYRAIVLSQLQKGCLRTIEDKLIYGDKDNTSSKEFDGLHAIVADTQAAVAVASALSTTLNVDNSHGALSMMTLRRLLDAAKVSYEGMNQNVFWLFPHELARRMDAMAQEAGIASYVGPYTIQYGVNDIGRRVMFFDGISIIRSDFLVAEQVDTGLTTATARGKYSSGTKYYSVFLVRTGQIMEGGLCLAFGGSDGQRLGEFYSFEDFEKLENYDAEGMRLKAYTAPALGSTKSLARITDISDAAVTS